MLQKPVQNDVPAADYHPPAKNFPEAMDNDVREAIKVYQCHWCIFEDEDGDCYKNDEDEGCSKHRPGFAIGGIGFIFSGLPKGFNRTGNCLETKIYIFRTLADGWEYNKFNVPVWKHLDDKGNTIVRGICPRLNEPWVHIFLSDCLDDIDCIEISKADIEIMN